jgi:hypothetical protein
VDKIPASIDGTSAFALSRVRRFGETSPPSTLLGTALSQVEGPQPCPPQRDDRAGETSTKPKATSRAEAVTSFPTKNFSVREDVASIHSDSRPGQLASGAAES